MSSIPFLYDEEAFQWYTSFDGIGDLLTRPNPTPALELLQRALDALIRECGWTADRIHLFGFAQGGSVAAELACHWWKVSQHKSWLGSVVTVDGKLLSYPTPSKLCPTRVLAFDRLSGEIEASSFSKGFDNVIHEKVAGEGMPRSRDEWEIIMRFWSDNLSRRGLDGMYPISS